MKNENNQNRISSLDGARGVAAFSVLIFHLFGSQIRIFGTFYLAVDFFFVLSGFVLAKKIENIFNTSHLRKFVLNRLIRIYPMVLAVISYTAIYDVIIILKHLFLQQPQTPSILLNSTTLIISLSLLQVFSKKAQLVDFPIWSLSAEWVINIFASFLKYIRFNIPVLFISLGLLLIITGTLTTNDISISLGRCCYGFALGILIFKTKKTLKFKRLFAFLALTITAFGLIGEIYAEDLSLLYMPLIFSFDVYVLANMRISNAKSLVINAKLGNYSYGFYLWHYPCLSLVQVLSRLFVNLDVNAFLKIVKLFVVTILTIYFTYVSQNMIEKPIQRRLKIFFNV